MVKFLHAADIHLDSPLLGLAAYEGAPVAEIRNATRRAFVRLVDLAVEEEVDFVLLAGDLFDGDWKDYQSGLFLVKQLVRLHDSGIRSFIIAGNHDAANVMSREIRLPDSVHKFGHKNPETVRLDNLAVAIHGQSFAEAAVTDNLAQGYPSADGGCFNIGLLHTCASGHEGHACYAPCTTDCLTQRGYDYWALGHVHTRQQLCADPVAHFPGNLQGRHIRECGAKGCLLVDVDGNQPRPRFVPLDVMRWERLDLRLSRARDFDAVLEQVEQGLRRLMQEHDELPLAVRIEAACPSPLYRQYLTMKGRWLADIRSAAISSGGGRVWIEKLKLKPVDEPARPPGLDSLGDLLRHMAAVKADAEELGGLADDLVPLLNKLPHEIADGLAELREGSSPMLQARLAEAEELLLGRLDGNVEDDDEDS